MTPNAGEAGRQAPAESRAFNAVRTRYCTLMPRLLMVDSHLAVSLLMKAANCCGVPGTACCPMILNFASISGELNLLHDDARIAKYWNAVAAAWNPQGKDDPRLTMMRLDCREAEVWLSQVGPVQFAWEIAVANARKHEPHLGGHANLRFH